MKKLILLILLLFSLGSFGQKTFTISGILTDKSNGETLFGASVFFKGTTIGVNSNEYGFYAITAPKGTYTLVFSYVGYTSIEKKIILDKNIKLNVELQQENTKLEEVVISSESKKVNLRTPQMSVSKLSSAMIKKIPTILGEVDILKSVQLLPGVTNAGEGASGFNVRGGAEDQNLILLDEAIIYNSSHLFGFFSVFNNDAIKNIKLYKGGIPAKFGGRASSVLDIRQKDGNKKNLKLSGGIGLISSRLTIETPTFKDKGSFLLAGRTTYANIFLAMLKNENRAGFYDFNLKTDYKINDNNKLYLSSYLGKDNINFAQTFMNSYGNISANLRWNHLFNDNLFSNLSLIFSKYDYDLELEFVGFKWSSDIKNYHLKYDFGYYLNDKMTFDFGLSTIYYQFNPGELMPTKANSDINYAKLDEKFALESGIYLDLEHKITPKFTAKYGLRSSYFSRLGHQKLNIYKDDLPVVYNKDLKIYERAEPIGNEEYGKGENIKLFTNLEPRLALSYQFNKNSSFKASYNKMVQYLHLISNTSSATPLDVWTPSGKFLKPQIANQYALGYFRNFNENTYSLELETYYKTIKNRVDYIDGADLVANNTIEREILSGNVRAYGLEFLLRKNKGRFTGWLAYTLSKSEQQTLGGRAGGLGINQGKWYNTAYDKTHDISITGNYKLNDKWRFGANFIFQTGRPTTYPNGQFEYGDFSVPTYSVRNSDRLPAYHRLDISATLTSRKNKNRRWKSEWVFGFYNVYNRRNAASISFKRNADTQHNEAVRTAIFGIIPSISYNFKF